MEKLSESIITNRELRDSSAKLIFSDNTLCSQFLRDYGGMDILRHIKPEDLEDVSDRYVPLFSPERNSDTVKKINISPYIGSTEDENSLNLPLFIVSLLEHKTKVEYNVCMQVLRYAVHIWENFEKDMEEMHPHISERADFRYPPILPIVYFEGTRNWTAPMDLSERIFCGELLGKYLPHFQYRLVRLHDYSNEELLERRDEISVAMIINKIQSPDDVASFGNLPIDKLNAILENTPEHLLDILSKLFRALAYSMGMSEDETEDAVGIIKERKMGRLFENQTINIPEMRREIAELKVEKDSLQTENSSLQAQLQAERQTTAQTITQVQKDLEIYKQISQLQRNGTEESQITSILVQKFSLTETEAKNYLD